MNNRWAYFASLVSLVASTWVHAGWDIERKADPLTDEKAVIASTSYSAGLGKRSVVVRCTGSRLEVYFDFDNFLNNDLVDVRYRLDKGPLVEDRWLPSADGAAVFASEDADLARGLARGMTFIIEATDFRGQPYRSTFDLAGASATILSVLNACDLSDLGMNEEVVGLRKDISLELERWGPKNIAINKKILASLGFYRGPQGSMVEPEFALAVQSFYDSYIERCKEGREPGLMCEAHRPTWRLGGKPLMPAVSGVIYERAPANLKAEAGSLRMGE